MNRKTPYTMLLVLLLLFVVGTFLVSCETAGETEPTDTARPATPVPTEEPEPDAPTEPPEPDTGQETPAIPYPSPGGTPRSQDAYPDPTPAP